jgi:hypothetical protein
VIPEIKKFGQELREFINSDEVFSILPEGDWGAGGCWILARALAEFLGRPAKLWAIASEYFDVEHVVVKDGNAYFDYNGASTKEELLAEFRSVNPNRKAVRLVPMTGWLMQRADETGIPCEPHLVKKLRSMLQRRFGPRDSH